MSTATELLARHEAALCELHQANLAVLALARSLTRETEAKAADDDEWTRLPSASGKAKCPVSQWSRSTLLRHIIASEQPGAPLRIRRKHVKGAAYYSAADVRRYIATQ